jgi:ComF family protein
MNPVRRIGNDLLHLIAPALCPACDTPLSIDDLRYCAACRASLEPAPFPREIYSELVGFYGQDEFMLSAIGSLYSFRLDSPVRSLIHAVKYLGCRSLGIELGRELGHTMRMFREFETVDAIVPVPLHRARRRERGYNQSAAIAEGVASVFGRPIEESLLTRIHQTTSQTQLSAIDRRRNVRDAFRAAPAKGRSVLLCDDVCTTGATLNACAEQLLAAGAARVLAVTVAKDRLDAPPGSDDRSNIVPGNPAGGPIGEI